MIGAQAFNTRRLYNRLAKDLISTWHLEETGAAARADRYGNNNLTAVNAPAAGTGIQNNGVVHTVAGATQLKKLGSTTLKWATGRSFSLSFWIKINPLPLTGPMIVLNWDGAANVYYWVYYAGTGGTNDFLFEVYQSGFASASSVRSGITVTAGSWNHLVCVYDDTTRKASIVHNGILSTAPTAISGDPITTNVDFYLTNNAVDAVFDEARCWNRALSKNEALVLYNLGRSIGSFM